MAKDVDPATLAAADQVIAECTLSVTAMVDAYRRLRAANPAADRVYAMGKLVLLAEQELSRRELAQLLVAATAMIAELRGSSFRRGEEVK